MVELAPSYERFAYAYDRIMYNVDYHRWADYIQKIFRHHSESPKSILDIACGTGALTFILSELGYQMTGVDLAEGMLEIARQKSIDLGIVASFMGLFERAMLRLPLPRPVFRLTGNKLF